MHLKSYQIDGKMLRTGAANFSASGLKRQDNDLIVIESAAAAAAAQRRSSMRSMRNMPVPRLWRLARSDNDPQLQCERRDDCEIIAMTDEEIAALFGHLYPRSIVNLATIEKRPPLLAHYTSLEVLEKIMANNVIWFSNPLFMNDLQEVRFGMLEGLKAFNEFALTPHFLEACDGSQEKVKTIYTAFHAYFMQFDAEHVLDVYVFCLSEHDPNNSDGVLSMWRGYGANGAGAALVFKTDSLTVDAGSPLLFAKVVYASELQRIQWMKANFTDCAAVLKESAIPADKPHHVAYHMFTLMKLYALVSKHHGFTEEREWRIIYLPERDTSKLLTGKFSYIIGKNGIEPKLLFEIKPLKIEPVESWTLDSILDRIILGPSISSPIVVNTVRRMFDTLKKPEFKAKLCASGIPLRSRSQ